MPKFVLCKKCNGTGTINGKTDVACLGCKGEGVVATMLNRDVLAAHNPHVVAELIYEFCDDCYFCPNQTCTIADSSICGCSSELIKQNIIKWLEEENENY